MQYVVRRSFSVMNKVYLPGEIFDGSSLKHLDNYIREKRVVALPMPPSVEAELTLYLRNRYGVEWVNPDTKVDVAIPQTVEAEVEVETRKVGTKKATAKPKQEKSTALSAAMEALAAMQSK